MKITDEDFHVVITLISVIGARESEPLLILFAVSSLLHDGMAHRHRRNPLSLSTKPHHETTIQHLKTEVNKFPYRDFVAEQKIKINPTKNREI